MVCVSREGPHVARRLWVLVVAAIVAMAACVAALGAVPQRADAYIADHFCPVNGSLVTIAAGSRCVDYRRLRHRYLQANIVWGGIGHGEYCVGAKENPDGTGGNTKGFGCSVPTLTSYTFSGAQGPPGSPLGYATIINNTGASDLFVGQMHYYP